jgi:hypothetical protein
MTTFDEGLQDRIAAIALRRVGESFTDKCGDFVREVMEEAGAPVEGRLRDVGEFIENEKRKAGDILMVYSYDREGKELIPFGAAIMLDQNSYIWKKSKTISVQEYHPSMHDRIKRVTCD